MAHCRAGGDQQHWTFVLAVGQRRKCRNEAESRRAVAMVMAGELMQDPASKAAEGQVCVDVGDAKPEREFRRLHMMSVQPGQNLPESRQLRVALRWRR